jgi:hypothetical protein
MAKQHELLAVQSNLETQANNTRNDLMNTFDKKKHLFAEKLVTFTPNTENAQAVTEEQSNIQTTVAKEITWISDILTKAIDASHQIDVANKEAKADIITEDGATIAKNVPATSLLQLEKTIKEVRDLALTIPTLDPAKGFAADDNKGKGVFQARTVRKTRTKKENKVVVLYPATDKHPAQVQVMPEDSMIGVIQEQEWSSMITPSTKSSVIDNCDVLMRAIRKARARANEYEIDVASNKIGKALLDFVFKPLQ